MKIDLTLLEQEYSPLAKQIRSLKPSSPIMALRYQILLHFARNAPAPPLTENEQSAVHFALVFLTASWIEDNVASVQAQREFI